MIPFFTALHTFAAQRGEGLRPELVRLLERAKSAAEASQRDSDESSETSIKVPQHKRAAA